MNTPKVITIATVLLFLAANFKAKITIEGMITDSELKKTNNALIKIIDCNNTTYYSSTINEMDYFNIANIFTDIEIDQTNLLPNIIAFRNYPNPFNPITAIKYTISSEGKRETTNRFLLSNRNFKTQEVDKNITDPKFWNARSGNWDFTKTPFRAQGFLRHGKAYYTKDLFQDFVYEVEINKLAEDGTFGLLFRYDEVNDEGYALEFWPHGGCIFSAFVRGSDRIQTLSINHPIHFISGINVWNKIKIIAKGSQLSIYLNDYLQDTIENIIYKSGRLGLYIAADARQIALFRVLRMEAL